MVFCARRQSASEGLLSGTANDPGTASRNNSNDDGK